MEQSLAGLDRAEVPPAGKAAGLGGG